MTHYLPERNADKGTFEWYKRNVGPDFRAILAAATDRGDVATLGGSPPLRFSVKSPKDQAAGPPAVVHWDTCRLVRLRGASVFFSHWTQFSAPTHWRRGRLKGADLPDGPEPDGQASPRKRKSAGQSRQSDLVPFLGLEVGWERSA
jgi:hypothetical protein